MEKTYFDIRVTFVHVVVFLIAVIAIGIFLFYMGYQAGQRMGGQPAGTGADTAPTDPALDGGEKIDGRRRKTDPGRNAVDPRRNEIA